jgi:seryl-tRNA synthetase
MGRIVWTVAMKLGARRMQRQVPSTLAELQAERTRLRAEYAMMSQRLGRQLEDARLRAAEQMAEVNRHRNRLRQMESGETADGSELLHLRSRVKALEAAVMEAGLRERELLNRLGGAEPVSPKSSRRKPAASRAAAPPPPPPPQDDPEILLRQRIEKLAAMAKPGHRAPPPAEPPPPEATAAADSAIAERLAEAERRTAELEEHLRKLDAEWAAKTASAPNPEDTPSAGSDEDNVIALSARIHNLRKSLGTQP